MKMKKIILLAVVALSVFAFSGSGTYAQANSVTVNLGAENNSGQTGTATLTEMGSQTRVVVNISGGSSTAQPAHIHKGQCGPTLDPKPAYPLTSLTNGTSETMVDANMAEIANGTYAVNIHKSAAEAAVYVSCGNISAMMTGAGGAGSMPTTGSGDQAVLLLALGLVALATIGFGSKLARRKA